MRNILMVITLLFIGSQTRAQSLDYSEWYLKTSDSLDLYVKEIGKGKDTIVVIHGGFGANHDYLLDAINGLKSQFHFVFYDQRGSLLSPAPIEKLTFEKNVNDLNRLIMELKIKKAKIMCHSMGTLVGMEFLKKHPQKVKYITLIGALPTKSDDNTHVYGQRVKDQVNYLTSRPEVQKLIAQYKINNGPDSTQVKYYNYASNNTDKEQTELWRIRFASVNIFRIKNWNLVKGGRAFYKQSAAVMSNTVNWTYDYRELLNNVEKSTIIMGDHDFLDFNAEGHKKLLQNYPKINIDVIYQSGHNIWLDNPDDFKKALIKSLSKSQKE